MSLGKFIKILIVLAIIGGGVYFAWDPVHNLIVKISPSMNEAADGFTGQTQVSALQRTKVKLTDVDLSTIRNAIEMYRVDHNGQLPKDLKELVKAGELSANNNALKDPWGNEYDSKVVGDHFYIISAGPDGVKGTEDDQTIDLTGAQTQ